MVIFVELEKTSQSVFTSKLINQTKMVLTKIKMLL